jgi:hypothetical protein
VHASVKVATGNYLVARSAVSADHWMHDLSAPDIGLVGPQPSPYETLGWGSPAERLADALTKSRG